MGKSKLFDNIAQVINVNITVAGGAAAQSDEIDLELPRGFVAKIHKIIVNWRNVFDLSVAGDSGQMFYAVLLDPDDATTTQMPENTVEHDVIMHGGMQIEEEAGSTAAWWTNLRHEIDFSHLEGMDVISARNLRFNIFEDGGQLDASIMQCTIYYTLEAIKDTEIMELLDIL